MLIQKEYLNNLSFPDYAVVDMRVNQIKKELIIIMEGACLENGAYLENLGKSCLYCNSWNQLVIKSFEHDENSNTWKNSIINTPEQLKDICEFFVENGITTISGFGLHTGFWVEYKVKGGNVSFSTL